MSGRFAKSPDVAQLATELTLSAHKLLSDVGAESGGQDAGPSPHELFDASLAACTVLTLKLYARRKQWPLEDVEIEIVRDDSQEKQGKYHLTRKLHLVGPLDDEQKTRLMAIADKCPIH
ncbi:MAG: OsmC family protein, partial [Candidatus Protistobacter heckmanni]|nr:OsmC family protein [Candidatus Protistobacter heckmanni]